MIIPIKILNKKYGHSIYQKSKSEWSVNWMKNKKVGELI